MFVKALSKHASNILQSITSKLNETLRGHTNHLLPEDPSISMNAHDSLVPEQVYPHSAHGAHGVEEGPGILHLP